MTRASKRAWGPGLGTTLGLLMVVALYGTGFFLPGIAAHGSATGWQNALEITRALFSPHNLPGRSLLDTLLVYLVRLLFGLSHLLFWIGVTLLAIGWRRASIATATVTLLAWLAWLTVIVRWDLDRLFGVLGRTPAFSAWLASMGLLAALSIGRWFQSRKEEESPDSSGVT